MDQTLDKINWLLRIIAVIALGWFIIQLELGLFLSVVVLAVGTFAPLLLGRVAEKKIPVRLDFFLTSSLFLGLMGNAVRMYERFWWYDNVMHTLIPLAFAVVFFYLLRVNYRNLLSPWLRVVIAASLALSIEVLWELLEYFSGQIAVEKILVKSLYDTNMDLLLGLVGSIIGAVVAEKLKKRSSPYKA